MVVVDVGCFVVSAVLAVESAVFRFAFFFLCACFVVCCLLYVVFLEREDAEICFILRRVFFLFFSVLWMVLSLSGFALGSTERHSLSHYT